MLAEDTAGIPGDAWNNIADGVKAVFLERREVILETLLGTLKGVAPDPAPTSFQDLIKRNTRMAVELMQASSAFCSCCDSVRWFPEVVLSTH